MVKKIIFPFAILSVTFLACSSSKQAIKQPILKEVFKSDFAIGAALNITQIEEKDSLAAAVIVQQFNAVTPENIMKTEVIHPEWAIYNFEPADKLVALAKKNKQQVNAHTLIWHSQLSPFVHQIQSVDSFRTFFSGHIKTIASRYDGKVYSWDVVNEALNEDGTMRQSVFFKKMGEDYVTEAFRLTQAASPNTQLYYNDYNNEQPAKRAGCIKLIKKIQASGVKIDGVGIQGHWHLGKIPLKEIEESIIQYAALGIKVAFTEVDIEVLPREFTGAEISQRMKSGDPSLNPYAAGLPDSVQQQLANDYAALFNLFLKHKDKIDRVTFWGVNDEQSWLNDWPVNGRTNYPLLFDRAFKPKPAFYKVIDTKSNKTDAKKAF